jgi:hypothetical protein
MKTPFTKAIPFMVQVFGPKSLQRFVLAVAWGMHRQQRQDDEVVKDTVLNRSTGKAPGGKNGKGVTNVVSKGWDIMGT